MAFDDAADFSPWALSYIGIAMQAGLVEGREHNRFAPKEATSRAESVQAIYNLLKAIQ